MMAEDERRMRETEEGFDASRLLRQMGERPLETTALSFAAGLVGMLKGSAGRTTPNDILAEVDKAVERDVMNQTTAYERMLKGMEVRRTNFLDARQMGADEQAALATTAAIRAAAARSGSSTPSVRRPGMRRTGSAWVRRSR